MQASADAMKDHCKMARRFNARKLINKARDRTASKQSSRCAQKYEERWSRSNPRCNIAERPRLRLATASTIVANAMWSKIRAVEKELTAVMLGLAQRAVKPM